MPEQRAARTVQRIDAPMLARHENAALARIGDAAWHEMHAVDARQHGRVHGRTLKARAATLSDPSWRSRNCQNLSALVMPAVGGSGSLLSALLTNATMMKVL